MVFSLSACGAQATPVYAEGAEKEAAAAVVEPMAQHIMDGILNNDYETFAADFSSSMDSASPDPFPDLKSAMTQEQFDKIVAMFAEYGAFQNRELITVQIVDTYYRANFQLTFEKKILNMGVVFPMTGTAEVSGLWFN